MTSIQIDLKDGLSSSTAVKGPCRVATTANITLSGEQTIDGVAVVTDDRVLVKDQTAGVDNGVWVVDTGAWRRAKDFNKTKDVKCGTLVIVAGGTVGKGLWQVSTADPITIGTTSLSFVIVSNASLTGSTADVRNYLDVAPYVATRTALKALDTTKDTVAYLTESGREGAFVWKTGDYSAQITADTQEGIYIKANAIASTAGAWVRAIRNVITPGMFGGVGDGVTDDGVALNAMFAYVRAESTAAGTINETQTTIELSGGKWRTTVTINATDLTTWNLTIRGGLIIGECTGKPVLDLVNSRGYKLDSVGFYGHAINTPSKAWQCARATTGSGACDNASFYDCSTTGYYSVAAIHEYGQETATHIHGTYFNYKHNARVAIFAGYDTDPVTSDYLTVVTGGVSHINNKLINCDFRYLPVGNNIATVSGVTNAANAVITANGHPFSNGDQVVFANIGGMPGMSNAVGTVSGATANTFTVNINSTSLGTYTGGGSVIRAQTKPSVLYSRGSQINFDCCYIVSYGQLQLEIAWPDTGFLNYAELDFDILFEGAGTASNILLSPGANSAGIAGFRLKTYQSGAYTSLISITDAGTVGINSPHIESAAPKNANVPLAVTAGKLGLYGARILWSGIANLPLANYASGSNGTVLDVNTGLETYWNSLNQTYTPTITTGSGTITTLGTVVGTIRAMPNKMIYLDLDIPITTNGTGAASVNATLPGGVTAARDGYLSGRENVVSGKSLIGRIAAGSGTVNIFDNDNVYPGANGARLQLSGWFERT